MKVKQRFEFFAWVKSSPVVQGLLSSADTSIIQMSLFIYTNL